MARAYSMDLRLRVLQDSAAGLLLKALAERYHVSLAWLDALIQSQRETGDPAPRKQTPLRLDGALRHRTSFRTTDRWPRDRLAGGVTARRPARPPQRLVLRRFVPAATWP